METQERTNTTHMKILIIVTSVAAYESGKHETGLWLSELTHLYHIAKEQGYAVTLASSKGGDTPMDPESLKPMVLDKISKAYWADTSFRQLLAHTKSLQEVAEERFDLVYLAGGHGTMYDFPDDTTLQRIIREHYEGNKIVAAICHGVGGLLNVRLSNGKHLIKGRTITGFNWFEENLARRKKEVPFNLEASLKARGSDYRKAFIPMTSKVVVDGNLITGQNPFSSKEMAKVVMGQLKAM
jgi:putative intracellular protease/amidase